MKKFYLLILTLTFLIPSFVVAQTCANFQATFKVYESRCAATGAIKIKATGGTGSYKYRVSGPVSINFTTTDSITGLSAGNYNIEVVDINSGCKFFGYSINVGGNYSDPRFSMVATDITCEGENNGTISATNVQNGRAPFTYTIVAPSTMGIGTANSNGVFTNLSAGNYTVQLTDSCGGIQTRAVSIADYSWTIQSHTFKKTLCDVATGTLVVRDSRGNVSNTTGINGMMYGIVRGVNDTLWSSNPTITFNTNGMTSTTAVAKDNCGKVKVVNVNLNLTLSVSPTVKIDNITCTSFRASAQGVTNFFDPVFYLLDAAGNDITNNTTGVFDNLSFGSYAIKVVDPCTGGSIIRVFSKAQAVVSLNANVSVLNKACNTFTARVTGQQGVKNPVYNIYDENDNLITSMSPNATGNFDNLPYGSYKITMKDGCVDTTIVRYVSASRPVPVIKPLSFYNVRCEYFDFNVTADSLYSAQYCLYDNNNVLVTCNNTGVFTNIEHGDYCVEINDLCNGTTIKRCFTSLDLGVDNDLSLSYNKTCDDFTVTVNTTNFKNSEFKLYKFDNTFVDENSTGIFSGLQFGKYYVTAHVACPETTVRRDFTVDQVKPTGNPNLQISNQKCDIFDLTVAGVSNLTSPIYTLKNATGVIISSGSSAKFTGLTYGKYTVEIKNSCYDTTLSVTQTFAAPARSANVTASKSCNYGMAKLTFTASVYPVTVVVMNPNNVMVASKVVTKANEVIDNLPALNPGEQYTVNFSWTCAGTLSSKVSPEVNFLNHSASVEQFCPGSTWPNGYGNIIAEATTNAGNLNVSIVKKNNVAFTKNADNNIGSVYSFMNLEPATYQLRYFAADGCNVYFYDEVVIVPYQYPDMSRSTAFQCDNTGFSVGAYINNGVGPFTYEIISSTPSTPSIVSPPQSSPIFNIDNGELYELIRLRAVDACGNATLGDASILPLANNTVRGTTDNCIGTHVKLSIDTVINSVVTWTYKKNENDQEIELGKGFSYQIDPFTMSDVGYYYCNVVMNNGCITRRYEFYLDGACHGVLPVMSVDLKGRMQNEKSILNWTVQSGEDIKSIIVERSNGGEFENIGQVQIKGTGDAAYQFTDEMPGAENQYRLKVVFEGGKSVYSKVIYLAGKQNAAVSVFPNPATDYVNIEYNSSAQSTWAVELISISGQKVFSNQNVSGRSFRIQRTSAMPSGMYMVKLTNNKTGEVTNNKVLFR